MRVAVTRGHRRDHPLDSSQVYAVIDSRDRNERNGEAKLCRGISTIIRIISLEFVGWRTANKASPWPIRIPSVYICSHSWRALRVSTADCSLWNEQKFATQGEIKTSRGTRSTRNVGSTSWSLINFARNHMFRMIEPRMINNGGSGVLDSREISRIEYLKICTILLHRVKRNRKHSVSSCNKVYCNFP